MKGPIVKEGSTFRELQGLWLVHRVGGEAGKAGRGLMEQSLPSKVKTLAFFLAVICSF